MKTAYEIEKHFSRLNLYEEARNYLKGQSKRYAYLLKILKRIRKSFPQKHINIMDVGPSYFTELLELNFPKDSIFTVGLAGKENRGGHFPLGVRYNKKNFFHFNLNNLQFKSKWIKPPSCDIIIIAEVIEHLYISPNLILNFIKTFLNNKGFLVIQTPNAASLYRRLYLLFGKNPYNLLDENQKNPHHIREYTKKEMFNISHNCNFEISFFKYKNYFRRSWVRKALLSLFPSCFSEGITIILRKKNHKTIKQV